MQRLEIGQKSDIFVRGQSATKHPEHLSFSVYYGNPVKTLDVVCKDQNEYNTWVNGLIYLIANKRKVIEASSSSTLSGQQQYVGEINVNLEDLRKQMHTHLDLCTWGDPSWGQLGHGDKIEDMNDSGEPKVCMFYIYMFVNPFDLLSLCIISFCLIYIRILLFHYYDHNSHSILHVCGV
jgi:hypothetical protein